VTNWSWVSPCTIFGTDIVVPQEDAAQPSGEEEEEELEELVEEDKQ